MATFYDLNMNTKKITNCGEPSASSDVGTKNYIDTFNFSIQDKIASYTLVATDNNKRIVMNNSSNTNITVNNGVFSQNNTIYILNKGTGSTTITAGAGVTINPTGGLVLQQWQAGTLVANSASVFFFFS